MAQLRANKEKDVDLIKVELSAIVALCLDLSAHITVTISLDGIQDCGSVFVNIVKLLTDLLNSITGACDTSTDYFCLSDHPQISLFADGFAGAIAALIDLVLSLLAHITLVSGCLLTNIEGLLGGVLALLAGVLRSLQLDITGCISLFTSACGPYHH